MRPFHVAFIGLFLSVASLAQAAPPRRFALLVGSNRGEADDEPLRFAEADAERMARVLISLGGFRKEDVVELKTPGGAALERALADLSARVAAEKTPPLLLFYYSGHADAESLHTGGGKVAFERLREWLRASHAAVRLAVLDSCRSGALTRVKGMHGAPAIDLNLANDINTRGEAVLTSSTSDELARESDALRGSFFTHNLVAGLRGAADQSKDGRVTLAEAYDYAYGKTVAQAEQHPTFKYDLAGRGDVVLTSLEDGGAWLDFAADATGSYLIFDASGLLLGDIDVGKAPLKIAVAPGRYEIRKRTPEGERAVRIVLGQGEERWIHDEEMVPVADDWSGIAKGPLPPVIAPPPAVLPTTLSLVDNGRVIEALRRRAAAARRTGYSIMSVGLAFTTLSAVGFSITGTNWRDDSSATVGAVSLQLLFAGTGMAVSGGLVAGLTGRGLARAEPPLTGGTPLEALLAAQRRRGHRRWSTGAALLWGGLGGITAGAILSGISQGIDKDSESFPVLATGIGTGAIGVGLAIAGGALYHSGLSLVDEADRGQLGPEFDGPLTIAPMMYSGGGGIGLSGSF